MRNAGPWRTGILAATLALGFGAAQAQTVSLRVSTGFPAVHDTTTRVVMPWLEELSRRSGVSIEPTLFAAGSSLGGLDRQLDQLQRGLVDVAVGLAVVPRGRMPRTGLADLPFLGADSRQVNIGLSSLIDTDLAPDFEGLHLVNLFVDCSVVHTVSTPVNTLADLRGLRLRVPSALGAAMVAAVGGIPVAMPQSEIYENLQRNVIDGAVTPWDVIESLNLGEVLNYHTENVLFCGQLWFAFSDASYAALPEVMRGVFDEIQGEFALDLAQGVYDETRASAQALARARGSEFTRLSDEDMAEWQRLVAPAVEQYLAETEAAGVADIREIYANLRAAIAAGASE